MQSKPQCAHNAAGTAVISGDRRDYCGGIGVAEQPVERLPSGIQRPSAMARGAYSCVPFVNAQTALVKDAKTVLADQADVVGIVEKRREIKRWL
jgi:hypothetical protein